MKISIQKCNPMNVCSKSLPIFALLFMLIFTTSCNKEEVVEELKQPEMTEEQAVEVVTDALQSETEGLVAEVEQATKITNQTAALLLVTDFCGESFDTSYMANISNNFITADFEKTIDWTVNCDNEGEFTSLTFQSSLEGQHETNRRMASSSGTAEWTIETFGLVNANLYKINGNYNRSGDYTWFVHNEGTYYTTLSITVTDLKVNKITKKIISGSAEVHIITGGAENTKTFDASVDFLGNGGATVTINGEVHDIQI